MEIERCRPPALKEWLSAIEPGLSANTTTASSVGSSRAPSPLPEREGIAKVEGGSGREKTNGNMWATINANGNGHAAYTTRRVGSGVNGVGSLPAPSSIRPGCLNGWRCAVDG